MIVYILFFYSIIVHLHLSHFLKKKVIQLIINKTHKYYHFIDIKNDKDSIGMLLLI